MEQELEQETQTEMRPPQLDEMEIYNHDERIFKCWGSVEVVDKAGEIIPMTEFKRFMPIYMLRGGPIMDRHSSRQIGKCLSYEFLEKETSDGLKLGILLTGQIFRNYEMDDIVWEGIKEGGYKGMSFGGRNKMEGVSFKGGKMSKILTGIEGSEFSLVPSGENQEATMYSINYLAKSETKPITELGEIEKAYYDVKKSFAGYSDFNDCILKSGDKDDPVAYCAAVRLEVENIEKNENYIKNASHGTSMKQEVTKTEQTETQPVEDTSNENTNQETTQSTETNQEATPSTGDKSNPEENTNGSEQNDESVEKSKKEDVSDEKDPDEESKKDDEDDKKSKSAKKEDDEEEKEKEEDDEETMKKIAKKLGYKITKIQKEESTETTETQTNKETSNEVNKSQTKSLLSSSTPRTPTADVLKEGGIPTKINNFAEANAIARELKKNRR